MKTLGEVRAMAPRILTPRHWIERSDQFHTLIFIGQEEEKGGELTDSLNVVIKQYVPMSEI
jgi:hypothetical protein